MSQNLALSEEQRNALQSALAPLFDYAATSPSTEIGEGYWDGQESAFNCGENQEQSRAAAIMRGVLVALGFTAPTGIEFCPDCDRDPDWGHSYGCSHADDEED